MNNNSNNNNNKDDNKISNSYAMANALGIRAVIFHNPDVAMA